MTIRARITRVSDGESRLYLSEAWGQLPGAYSGRQEQANVFLLGPALCNCFRHMLFEDAGNVPRSHRTDMSCGTGAYRLDWVEECGVRLVQDDAFWSIQQEPTEQPTAPAPLPAWLELHPSWLPHLDGAKPQKPSPSPSSPKSRRPPRLPAKLPTAQRG